MDRRRALHGPFKSDPVLGVARVLLECLPIEIDGRVPVSELRGVVTIPKGSARGAAREQRPGHQQSDQTSERCVLKVSPHVPHYLLFYLHPTFRNPASRNTWRRPSSTVSSSTDSGLTLRIR